MGLFNRKQRQLKKNLTAAQLAVEQLEAAKAANDAKILRLTNELRALDNAAAEEWAQRRYGAH